MKQLIKKYQDIICYLFFGVCTTIANIGCYALSTRILHWETVSSTIIAWFTAVALAYITNRQWVFHSTAKGYKSIAKEAASFFTCRIATGIMDILIMYVFVTILHFPDIILKAISNILVVITNYIASKLVIFK